MNSCNRKSWDDTDPKRIWRSNIILMIGYKIVYKTQILPSDAIIIMDITWNIGKNNYILSMIKAWPAICTVFNKTEILYLPNTLVLGVNLIFGNIILSLVTTLIFEVTWPCTADTGTIIGEKNTLPKKVLFP